MSRDLKIDVRRSLAAGVLAVAILAAGCVSTTPTAGGADQELPLADAADDPGDDGAIDPAPAVKLGCSAEGALDGVVIRWWDMPAGVNLTILADGAEVADAVLASPDDAFSLFGAPDEPGPLYEVQLSATGLDPITIRCGQAGTLATIPAPTCSLRLVGGKPQLVLSFADGGPGPIHRTPIRDGIPVDGTFLDNTNPIDIGAAPGGTYTYQIEVGDNSDRPPVKADCGTITVPNPSDRMAELAEARELFHGRAVGPYIYFDATFDDELVSLHMEPSPDGGRFLTPRLEDETLRDPLTVHDDLAAAIEQGQDVGYRLDAVSGLPLWWVVDGIVGEFHCIEADTAPPEIRARPCDPAMDMMGL